MTAVIDLDLNGLPSLVKLPVASKDVLVLVRLGGVPVGRAVLPARGGRILVPDLQRALVDACGWAVWDRWLAEALELPRDGIPPQTTPTATIAVCTRDRPDDLRACLSALEGLPDDGQEVVVVDNAPTTDAARSVVGEFAGVRYILEPEPGLNVARQRALREASGEVVAFTDDDARPDPGWLRALLANFHDPLVLCVTGLTMPLELETPAQELFERISPFARGFTRRIFQSPPHDPLVAGPIGAGANMALRRLAVEQLGGFDEALDAGTPTKSGGDHELFTRLLASGHRIVYDPAALVWHRHRRDWHDLRATIHGYGVGVYAAWTRALVVDRELGVPAAAWRWFRRVQLRALARAMLRRPDAIPLNLVLAELLGCAEGPWAYWRSRRALERRRARV
jgi:GT2 family glycosyltransferase